MAEYIEREAAMRAIKNVEEQQNPIHSLALTEAMVSVEYLRAAEVEPVRHGMWMQTHPRDTVLPYECSVCCGVVERGDFSYCPNCGAKMDADED